MWGKTYTTYLFMFSYRIALCCDNFIRIYGGRAQTCIFCKVCVSHLIQEAEERHDNTRINESRISVVVKDKTLNSNENETFISAAAISQNPHARWNRGGATVS